jgi:hypothetical protein
MPISSILSPTATELAQHVADGLHRTPKALSSMYFYDDAGSRLFQQIMDLPEYYPTRAEFSHFPGARRGHCGGPEPGGRRRLRWWSWGPATGLKTKLLLRESAGDRQRRLHLRPGRHLGQEPWTGLVAALKPGAAGAAGSAGSGRLRHGPGTQLRSPAGQQGGAVSGVEHRQLPPGRAAGVPAAAGGSAGPGRPAAHRLRPAEGPAPHPGGVR